MMSYSQAAETKDKNSAYKKFAQVFTPSGVVFFMIMHEEMRPCVQGLEKTMFDPCCGEGQFPCAELVLKMFYNMEDLNEATALIALASLYGMDIQATSVEKTHNHLVETISAAYKFFTGEEFTEKEVAKKIAEKNFWQGDSLKQMREWVGEEKKTRQMTLF